MRFVPLFLAIGLSASFSGCALIATGPEPGKITLAEAMHDVATGLNDMYDIRSKGPKSGLLPAEVTIVFNVSASTKDAGKLYVEAGANPVDVLKIVKAGGEVSSEITTARGNQVTIKFLNVVLAPKDTLLTIIDADKTVFDALKGADINPMLTH
jgi:hypothetical protein